LPSSSSSLHSFFALGTGYQRVAPFKNKMIMAAVKIAAAITLIASINTSFIHFKD